MTDRSVDALVLSPRQSRTIPVSLLRNNIDRDPKDVEFSVHGLTLAYGATSKLELFSSIGVQSRVGAAVSDQRSDRLVRRTRSSARGTLSGALPFSERY